MDLVAPTPAATVAPSVAPDTISATQAAANAGSFTDFEKASAAARSGKPLPDVPAPVKAEAAPASEVADPNAPATPVAPAETRKQREERQQQEANERVRRAVELATADVRAELAALKGTPRIAATPPNADAAPTLEEFQPFDEKWQEANPGKTYEHYLDQRLDHREQQKEQQRLSQDREAQRTETVKVRTEQYTERLLKAKDADPDIMTKIPPAVLTAVPLSHCGSDAAGHLIDPTTGKAPTFANVAAEAAMRSDNPAALLTYLHAHQDDAVRIGSLPPGEWLEALARLDGRLSAAGSTTPVPHSAAPAVPAAVPSTISAAPPPAPTLSRPGSTTDPKTAALTRGDFATFDKLEMQERRARRAGA